MIHTLDEMLAAHRKPLYLLFRRYLESGRVFLLHSDLVDTYDAFLKSAAGRRLADTPFTPLLRSAEEAVLQPPLICLALRARVASWDFVEIHTGEMRARRVDVSDFLAFKERTVDGTAAEPAWTLEIDLRPFERGFPKLKEVRSIGRGVEFLNRHLSNELFHGLGKGDRRLFEFLKLHQIHGRPLMLGGLLEDCEELRGALAAALDRLADVPEEATWSEVAREMVQLGFEPGWGRTVARIRETMVLLSDILEAPSPENLEQFLRRIPMIFSIAIVSPHGYFGQSDVLGKPDTGGQVVYILDQVRALEGEMRRSIADQGLDIEPDIVVLTRLIPDAGGTTCDQRIERIHGTRRARILRVPFRDRAGETVPHWISRFMVWPYLERFAHEAEGALLGELGGKPDFLIGNYSDGNLVASLLSRRLGVTQCNVAHALEKTKYLHADLYWREHEPTHHFSCQFTADLIAMNTADFIITSTYQEIAGTRTGVGQYESYKSFTLPGLYRVVSGIDPFDPKFNIVSPGADPDVFFPHHDRERRLVELHGEIRDLVHGGERPDARGHLADVDKPLLFAMSRLDPIKNLTGLVDWYGCCPALREQANLFLVGGFLDPAQSADREERAQIERLHTLFAHHGLDGQARWVAMQMDKNLVGELYRFVADSRGVFVQPALFEAFGLTVIEAMTSGLPTFATRYGGPLESIEHGISGFHIDPNHGDEAAAAIAAFLEESRRDPERWDRISAGAIARVQSRYTWSRYASRLLALSRIYGFWKFISNIEREETRRYLEMFYGLMFKPLAEDVPSS
ncbi:MAG: sucrose synthase [Planctomycetes bacterium]|nr:sucrose synthase [Planctomycetota bacterium]